jgi:hypothetical protein
MNPESLIAVLFGGREKLDCWLSKSADQLADPEIAKPAAIPGSMIPESFQALMLRPREVIDGLLSKLQDLHTWGYTVRVQGGLATVLDDLTGHVAETVPVTSPEEIQELVERYGPCVVLEAE